MHKPTFLIFAILISSVFLHSPLEANAEPSSKVIMHLIESDDNPNDANNGFVEPNNNTSHANNNDSDLAKNNAQVSEIEHTSELPQLSGQPNVVLSFVGCIIFIMLFTVVTIKNKRRKGM